MSKGIKIQGQVEIIDCGSSCQGACGLETPYLILKINGEEYRWQSDKVEYHDLWGRYGKKINIEAFRRDDSNRLYKVKLIA